MIRWACGSCGQRYWLRRSCQPCQLRVLHAVAMRMLDLAMAEVMEATGRDVVRRALAQIEGRADSEWN